MCKTMQQDATRLTSQQEQAAELLAAGRRVGDVAQAVGIDRTTIWRWSQLPGFQEVMNGLRRAAWRAAADRMRSNTTRAAEVLGEIMDDTSAEPRDRIAAAKVVLGAAGPLFPSPSRGKPEPVESRGVPTVEHDEWRRILNETAERATAMAGHLRLDLPTPGQAWAHSGLEAAFPGSYQRLRALADRPEELREECARILAEFEDALDATAVEEAAEEVAD